MHPFQTECGMPDSVRGPRSDGELWEADREARFRPPSVLVCLMMLLARDTRTDKARKEEISVQEAWQTSLTFWEEVSMMIKKI